MVVVFVVSALLWSFHLRKLAVARFAVLLFLVCGVLVRVNYIEQMMFSPAHGAEMTNIGPFHDILEPIW